MEVLLGALTPVNLLVALLGTVLGIVFGALPGVGPTLAIALMLSLTFGMPPDAALIFLGSIFGSTIYGGSISAILLNVPGTPGSVATSLDGHPMAQQGKGGVALGISTTASTLGGMASLLLLWTLAPVIARVSVKIGPAEYFMLALLGLSIVASVSRGATLKGFLAACLGLMLTFFGYDLITGYQRFTFGLTYLEDGIPEIQLIIGLFGIAQALALAEEGGTISKIGEVAGSAWKGIWITLRYYVTLLRSIAIGALLGTLPGVGITTANFLAYNEAMRSPKDKHIPFGQGNPEGVVASEAANNAVEGGALIPTLTLGIPGSAASALFLGALMIQGLRPGMELFTVSGKIVYSAFAGMLLGFIMMFLLGMLGARFFVRVTLVPSEVLVPLIILLTLTGSYAVANSLEDVILTALFGFIGYVMNRHHYPTVPLVLGVVLGSLIEKNFHRALLAGHGSYAVFVTRPISLILLLIIVVAVLYPYLGNWLKRSRAPEAPAANNKV